MDVFAVFLEGREQVGISNGQTAAAFELLGQKIQNERSVWRTQQAESRRGFEVDLKFVEMHDVRGGSEKSRPIFWSAR